MQRTADYGTEPQAQWIHLKHNYRTLASGDSSEEGAEDCKSQKTRKSAMRLSPRNNRKSYPRSLSNRIAKTGPEQWHHQ